jgi:hypothetical protein
MSPGLCIPNIKTEAMDHQASASASKTQRQGDLFKLQASQSYIVKPLLKKKKKKKKKDSSLIIIIRPILRPRIPKLGHSYSN